MMYNDNMHGGLQRLPLGLMQSQNVLRGPATYKVNPEYIGDSAAIFPSIHAFGAQFFQKISTKMIYYHRKNIPKNQHPVPKTSPGLPYGIPQHVVDPWGPGSPCRLDTVGAGKIFEEYIMPLTKEAGPDAGGSESGILMDFGCFKTCQLSHFGGF